MRTHFKPKETFQHTFFTTCHPQGPKKGFVKGETLRILRTNSSNKTFEENITTFKKAQAQLELTDAYLPEINKLEDHFFSVLYAM